MKIGVFDSGLGGITVLKDLILKYPYHEYFYYADLKNNPYGEKDYSELEKIGSNIINELEKVKVNECVCACGTLSSISNSFIFNENNKIKQVHNIIDPIVSYMDSSKNNSVLLLATPATIKKGVFENRIREKYSNLKIYKEGCSEFVNIIENNISDEEYIQNTVNKYVEKYNGLIDTVILGCTHYILLEKYILNRLPDIKIIDAGNAFVNLNKNKEWLEIKNIDNNQKENIVHIIMSDYRNNFEENCKKILPSDCNLKFIVKQ